MMNFYINKKWYISIIIFFSQIYSLKKQRHLIDTLLAKRPARGWAGFGPEETSARIFLEYFLLIA